MSKKYQGKPFGTQPADLLRKIRPACIKAADEVKPLLDEEFDRQMRKVKWDWPNDTHRKNGKLIRAGDRDIIDTQKLFNSKQFGSFMGTSLQWTWGGGLVKYAAVVHNGATLKSGKMYPARPWTTHAEKALNVDKIITDIIRKELDG